MRHRYIEEPSLQFGYNQHICPRAGIAGYGPFDISNVRPEKIVLGIIGKSESIQKVCQWITTCKTEIAAKKAKKGKKTNEALFPAFPGFNGGSGFFCDIAFDDTYLRTMNNSDLDKIVKKNEELDKRIMEIAEIYLNEIKYLTKNKKPDVILCVLSENLIEYITEDAIEGDPGSGDASEEKEEIDEQTVELERNFRRYLKAKAMQYQVPIQIVRDRIGNPTSDMQDEATIAWNFFTALYYKAAGTPWALIRKDMAETTCYAGISFYRSRDKKTTQTSIAQIFNELGKGVILRGEEIVTPKNDRSPHLTEKQAFNLMDLSLKEYLDAIKQTPKRIVIHKTSHFSDAEIAGFREATQKYHIQQVDMVSLMDADIRLYRQHAYPPLRGTHFSFDDRHHLLYTRGSVPYYETYTGLYIPRPMEVTLFEYDESPDVICDEIVALTKMNWNNTQFDRKYPITIECARNVGDILKYLEDDDEMQLRYSFYM